jgi:hypothetical protein
LDKEENISRNFIKVIRTPYSCRTFIIGGDENSKIREIKEKRLLENVTTNIIDFPCIFGCEAHCSFDEGCSIDIFQKSTQELGEFIESSHLNINRCIQEVKCIYNQDAVERFMHNLNFRDKIQELFQKVHDIKYDIANLYQEVFHTNMNEEEENIVDDCVDELSLYELYSLNNKKEETKDAKEHNEKLEKFVLFTFTKILQVKAENCIEKLEETRDKIGHGIVKTEFRKQNHSLAADKDFVYITGGSVKGDERSFEIFILKENICYKGPDLLNPRNNHSSFIKEEYLYVFGGEVNFGSSPTYNMERIKTSSAIGYNRTKDPIEHYYDDHKWE